MDRFNRNGWSVSPEYAKTDRGWVIEFQHSYIKPEERRSRNTFYHPKLVWMVNGARRKRDRTQFDNALNEGKQVGGSSIVQIAYWDWDECRLLREWAGSHAPIFFDFGEKVLWWLFSMIPNGPVYVVQYPRTHFIEIHSSQKSDDFEVLVKDFNKRVANYESEHLAFIKARQARLQPPQGLPAKFHPLGKRHKRL